MRYVIFCERALPIGSDTVESASNRVVNHHYRRLGRGRKRDSHQAIVGRPQRIEYRSFQPDLTAGFPTVS